MPADLRSVPSRNPLRWSPLSSLTRLLISTRGADPSGAVAVVSLIGGRTTSGECAGAAFASKASVGRCCWRDTSSAFSPAHLEGSIALGVLVKASSTARRSATNADNAASAPARSPLAIAVDRVCASPAKLAIAPVTSPGERLSLVRQIRTENDESLRRWAAARESSARADAGNNAIATAMAMTVQRQMTRCKTTLIRRHHTLKRFDLKTLV